MKHGTARSRLLFILPLLSLLACESGTGSERGPRLAVAQAAPFSLVEIHDLSDQYLTGERVTVGGVATALVRDEADGVHRFMLPDLPPGAAEVVIPGKGRRGEARLALTVLPVQYAGGTPGTALAEMGRMLDSLQVSVSQGIAVVSPEDDQIRGLMDAFLAVAQVLQLHVDTLSGPDRAAVAGLYSAMAGEIRMLSAYVATGMADLRGQPPILGGRGAAEVAIPSATALVTRCENFNRQLEVYEAISNAMNYVLTSIEVLSWFGGPAGRAGAAALSMMVGLGLDIGSIIANSVPNLIDPQGLRLQASPPRIAHRGDQGTLRAWVRRRSAGELLEAGAGLGETVSDVRDLLDDYGSMRRRMDVAKLAVLLGALAYLPQIQSGLAYLDQQISDFLNDEIIEPGEVRVTFDGITFGFGWPSSSWEFVDGATAPDRRFRSLGSQSVPVQQFQLEARIGTSNRCKASTGPSRPAQGINGFEISTGAEVRFTGTAEVEMRPNEGTTTTIGLHNRGVDTSGALTYRMQHPSGAGYVPPAWLAVSIDDAPTVLGTNERGTMRLSIGVADEAPERSVTVPIAVVDDDEVVDNTTLTVTVRPQPVDLVVNRSPSTFRLWDYGTEDGDIITVTLNGSSVVSGTSLLNAGTSFPITYRRGRNLLIIRAHNEGPLPPNTTGISFGSVVRGDPSRAYPLNTGQVVRLVILYDPKATPGGAAASSDAAPVPTYAPCAEAPDRCEP